MRIGTIVAMDKELVQLKSLLDERTAEGRHNMDFIRGDIDGKEVILHKCGIGKVNSAIGTVEMINAYHPDVIVSTGGAGVAGEDVRVTDVVVGTEYLYHDAYCGRDCAPGQIMGMPPRFHAPRDLVRAALEIDGGARIHAGLIVTGEWFVDSREKMASILEGFPGAMAVDMESCSIAQACFMYGVPFISFRVISDVPMGDTGAAQYFDFWARIAEGSFNVTRRFLKAIKASDQSRG